MSASMAAGASGPAQKGIIPLPPSLVICPWGESRDLSGAPVIVNETTVAELAANQSRYGFEEVALDFGHNTVPPTGPDGKPEKAPEPLPIAAMGTLSVEPGIGIRWTPSSWTPEGEHYYTRRHYKDLSPTVGRNEKGEVIFIHSIALTRTGQISGLHAFSANQPLPPLTNLSTPITMDTPDYRALLIAKLNLPADATDEAITAALASTETETPPAAPATEPMAAPAAPDVTALSARLDKMERDNLVSEATRAGKVIPLSTESIHSMPLTALQELIEKTPATVPMSATTPAAPAATQAPAIKPLSAEEATVAARLGYTAEQFRAANPA